MSSTHKMIVLAKASDGRVDDLETWYRTQHIRDVLAVPGFVSADLMSATMLKQPEGSPGWDFVTIYTIDNDEPLECVAEAGRRLGTPLMPRDPVLHSLSTISVLASATGDAE